MSRELSMAKAAAFMDAINSKYKSTVGGKASTLQNLRLKRFSTGILPLDIAMGGGHCFNRIELIAGDYSTGKTVIALKAFTNVQEYCKNCRMHQTRCKCGKFSPCIGLFIDQEGALDIAWAKRHGFDDSFHLVARPEYAEQATDILDAAIRDNTFDLIVTDSLAAMTPKVEIEKSSEEQQMGVAARLLNKGFRRWQSSLNAVENGPCLIFLNQPREKIGVMFGSPEYFPGGKGQLFASSIIVRTSGRKVIDEGEEKKNAWVELGGTVKKNKTFTPQMEFDWTMCLIDTEDGNYKVGDADNFDKLLSLGKKYGFVKKTGSNWTFEADICVPTEKAFVSHLKNKPDVARKLWRSIVNSQCGTYV